MKSISITLDGVKIDLPILEGSEGEKAIDVTHLRKQTGYITLDPGYMNSGSCISNITYIDGDKGILRYRGIPIEQLAEKASFTEVAYLLIYGRLPNEREHAEFANKIKRHTMIHEDMKRFFDGYPMNAHPMGVLASTVAAMSTFYPEKIHQDLDLNIIRLLGKMPTLAAYSYKKSNGQPFVYPSNNFNYEENFLYMMFSIPPESYTVDSVVADTVRLLFILHADHEQNCSTSTVRMVGSSKANLFISVAAGIAALWGKLHGGANQQVIETLLKIVEDGGDYKKYIELAKDKSSGFKLPGFGHRVYKNFDPRAKILKATADRLFAKLKITDPLLEVAKEIEEIALKDDYFIQHKLYPNVDFYSGILYRAIGIPIDMFTVMFALGRLSGWIAQWKEMYEDPQMKIYRPRQIYNGNTVTEYLPWDKR